jgi:hypothetical protein
MQPKVVLAQQDPTHSGGSLMPEQAAYDASFYDIDLKVNPYNTSIEGKVTVQVIVVHLTRWFVLNLDNLRYLIGDKKFKFLLRERRKDTVISNGIPARPAVEQTDRD